MIFLYLYAISQLENYLKKSFTSFIFLSIDNSKIIYFFTMRLLFPLQFTFYPKVNVFNLRAYNQFTIFCSFHFFFHCTQFSKYLYSYLLNGSGIKKEKKEKKKEHSKSLGNKGERSALWKHCREKHSSEIQQFQMNVTGVYFNDAMLRQISRGYKDQQCR